MSEDQTELKADTAAGADAQVTMTPEAAAEAAQAAEKAKEPTLQDQLNVLLAKKKAEKGLSLKDQLKANRLAKQIKMKTRERKQQREMFENYFMKPQKKQQEKLMREVNRMKDEIGRKDFQMLRDIFTIVTPEKLDEAGKVLEPASTQVNWVGLIQEAKNVIVIQREQRIKMGLRKRSTGRSSDRQAHRSAVAFLLKRDAEETLKAAQAQG